jgi:EAL domain-containing protein (putative c-di-GMP-specific phosphodiesterase class I)
MSLKALAEGVETEGQLAFLRVRGCDSFQGYLFCRPQPAAEVETLLRRHGTTVAPPRERGPRRRRRLRA